MLEIVVKGKPITKKNSMRMVRDQKTGRMFPIPSKAYVKYQALFLSQIKCTQPPIKGAVNVKAIYYMPTKNIVDLTNLMNATHDLLVDARILADDESKIVAGVDGSRVKYDKLNPRVEITITEMEPDG